MTNGESGYSADGESLSRVRHIPEAHLDMIFRAEQIRQERTGVHARLTILLDGQTLAWSSFNIERDEDRVRLANSAYLHMERLKEVHPKTLVKNDLDRFCYSLWDAYLDQHAPELLGGSSERHLPDFLVRPLILDGGGTLAFAPPGRGKSYVMMLLQVSLDAGVGDLWTVRPVPTLMVNLERSKRSVLERLGNINEVLGLARERRIPIINARGRSLGDVSSAVERYIGEHGIQCVFVDSISRSGQGGLGDDQSGNRIIDVLNRIAPSWFALAHTPRADETHVFGTVMFEAGADIMVQLLSQQEAAGPLGIGLQITKNNDIGPQSMGVLALDFDQRGLVGVRQAKTGEFPEIDAGRKLSMREAVIEHLRDMGPQHAQEVVDGTGFSRTNIAHLLATDPAFVRGGRLGAKVLYALANP